MATGEPCGTATRIRAHASRSATAVVLLPLEVASGDRVGGTVPELIAAAVGGEVVDPAGLDMGAHATTTQIPSITNVTRIGR